MKSLIQIVGIILGALLVGGVLFLLSLMPTGDRSFGPIESIHGIPFYERNGAIRITEKLAHADVYLREPVAFKRLVLTVDFDPGNLQQLDVGVREGEFWLSYPRHTLFNGAADGRQTVTIPINVTDKLQDSDRSIDVMFFATAEESIASEYEGVDDTAEWTLYTLTAKTEFVVPSAVELKDYLRSILKRERPL